ncbi:MAG: 50S ribosomal protein L30 [Bacteroidetes bacterium HGW-Bacteroidetes-9]|jgi:large subunit ribosomal protein L30|nr:MAG: 50S ribosomal protein L30 [Bacteroidetes bacterium HGW-Bacteroidetes-9]
MKKLKVTQIRSGINQPERQKRTLKALGIAKVGRPIEVVATPQIEGMIAKLNHLLKVEEI